MPDVSAAISNLQSKWHDLKDLDRARAVYAIHRAGTSVRTLAKELGFSESLLRHLLTALPAPAEDRYLTQQGKITTNELVRRAKAAGARRSAKQREALALQHIQDAREAWRKICQWLVEEGIPGSYGEQIVTEARHRLAVAEITGKLPKTPLSPTCRLEGSSESADRRDPSPRTPNSSAGWLDGLHSGPLTPLPIPTSDYRPSTSLSRYRAGYKTPPGKPSPLSPLYPGR